MSLPLCEAVLRAYVRRVAAAGRRSPVAVAAVALAWLAAPVAAWHVGAGLAATFEPALDDPGVTRALTGGLCFSAAALGAMLGLALPFPDALGMQIAAAPVSRRSLVTATALPLALGSALCMPLLAAAVVPLASAAPGGSLSAAPVLVALAAASAAGALVAEGASRMCARRPAPIGLLGAGGGVVSLLLAFEAAARGLRDDRTPSTTLIASAALVSCAAAWPSLVATRSPRAGRSRRRVLLEPRRRPLAALAMVAAQLLSRRAETQLVMLAAAGFGVLGLAVAATTGATPVTGALLGGGSCVVASCFVPLSVRGRIDPGAWVWRTARRSLVAVAWGSAALALVTATSLPVYVVALAHRGPAPAAAAQIAALSVLAWAAALASGAVLPRRDRGAGDDAISLGAFAAVSIALGAVAAGAGARLDAVGVPGVLAVAGTLLAASVAAVAVLGAMWGRT